MLSNWFWKKLEVFVSWLLAGSLFSLVVFLANIEIKDLDLWLHLGVGRHILSHFSVPQVDFLSCTISGQPWINHEWLFQIIVAFIDGLFGTDGLIVLEVAVLSLSFFLLWMLGGERRNSFLTLFSLLLVLLVYQHRLLIRPDIFSLLFLILYFYILSSLEARHVFIKIFFLQVVWTNFHGFFILGPLVVLLALAAESIKRRSPLFWEWGRVGRLNEEEYRNLKWVALISFLACLVNPSFLRGAVYPFLVLFSVSGDSEIFFQDIGELQPLLTMQGFFSGTEYLPYIILFFISGLSFVLNRRKVDIGILFLWGALFLFSLKASRNIAFFAVASYLAILINFRENLFLINFFKKSKLSVFWSILAKSLLIVFIMQHWRMMSLHGYFDFDTYKRKSEFGGVSLRNFPYKAADFLVQNRIQGHFFNDFNSGAYLIGRAFPNVKVFIDGRTEVYGAGFYGKYDSIFRGDAKLFEEAVERYQLTGVFLGSVYVPVPKDFIRYLARHPGWSLVYFDYDATIFLKNVPQNEQWISRYKVDLNQWRSIPIDLFKVGARKIIPYQHINRAYALFHMGFYKQAREEVQEAVNAAPQYVKSYEVLGAIDLEEKKFAEAYGHLRKALLLNPSNFVARHQIATALYHLDRLTEAEVEIVRILSSMPQNAKTKYLLSSLRVKEKKYKEALETFQEAYTILPTLTDEILEVGDEFCAQEQYSDALDVYSTGIQSGKNLAVAYEHRAACYQKQGKDDLAREDLSKSLEAKSH